ncbi:ferritin-like domain-containing protein [Nocardioides dongkuii]|uniref:ferritin-like domain-containing protein n=1 Tax=Nocardioides dongkuii TaxID=2760089 RepID=UPI0018777978|nr:ferritin-like domain-containing protein [Nocardioides dongkuii]
MTAAAALRAAVQAEHAAIYVYGVLGAQTSATAQPELHAALVAAYAQHRARRDQLVARMRDLGETPPAAAPAYDVPPRLDDVAVVREQARRVEATCAATYAHLVGSSTGSLRRWAIGALTDAAVRGLTFGAEPEVLPGT